MAAYTIHIEKDGDQYKILVPVFELAVADTQFTFRRRTDDGPFALVGDGDLRISEMITLVDERTVDYDAETYERFMREQLS